MITDSEPYLHGLGMVSSTITGSGLNLQASYLLGPVPYAAQKPGQSEGILN